MRPPWRLAISRQRCWRCGVHPSFEASSSSGKAGGRNRDLTPTPPAEADGYNKLTEVYWACICIAQALEVDLDHPETSDGTNPDVITNAPPSDIKRGYAFKTVRSPWVS